MTVSSQIANPSLTPLELKAQSLAQLDPFCGDYLFYPKPNQFLPHTKPGEHLQALKRSTSYSASMSIDLGDSRQVFMAYQTGLEREIALQGQNAGKLFRIHHLQLRGRSIPAPTLDALLRCVRSHFTLLSQCEFGLMLALPDLPGADLAHWSEQGFHQLQLTHQVGESLQTLPTMITLARKQQFNTIRINLGFGLAQQSLFTLARTLNTIIASDPDQIVFLPNLPNYEHLYWCIKHLHAAGYYYLGAYCFTKAQDDLVRAKHQGRLHRDLQGYTTQNGNNHIACGLGGISSLGNYYCQNTHQLDTYIAALTDDRLPLARSLSLSMDDLLRRIVMQLLICQFELSIQALELSYPIQFQQYFSKEMTQLQNFAQSGWISIDPERLQVHPKGELFIYQICAVFDRYRHPGPKPD